MDYPVRADHLEQAERLEQADHRERADHLVRAGHPVRAGGAHLPRAIQHAVTVADAGATGVARLVIEGLLEIVDDRAGLAEAVAFLRDRLPGYAPIWHIARAAGSAEPAAALAEIRRELDRAVARSVATAAAWVARHGGPVLTAPSSSVVAEVLSQLGRWPEIGGPGAGRTGPGPAGIGLAGADAIGPTRILNIKGTRDVAQRVPTLVVSTSLKLVPESVFATLGAPTFETIPLHEFAGVILDGELLTPRQAGERAAAIMA